MADDEHHSTTNQEPVTPAPFVAPEVHSNGNGHKQRPKPAARDAGLFTYDRDAEAALLGALLYGADPAIVDPSAWTTPGALGLHATITTLHTGRPLDLRLVVAHLGDQLDALQVDIDGIVTQGQAALALIDTRAPAASSAQQFADIVTSHHQRRQLAATIGRATEALRTGDIDQAAEHLRHATTEHATPATSLRVHWVHDTLEQPPPVQTDLVQGILRRGEITGFGAKRAVGKSWFAMNLATLLARGDGWFLGALKVNEPARTLYCHGEMDHEGAARRWEHLAGAFVPPDGIAESFDRWRLRVVEHRATTTRAGGSDSDRWYRVVLDDRLETTISEHKIDVLVIDPWAVYYAGQENSNDEVEAAVDELRRIAIDHDIAILVPCHLRKGDDETGEPEDAWRGASRLADSVNNRITFLPHYTTKQAENQGMTRQQARRYQDAYFLRRSGPAPADISVAWNPETGWWERWATESVGRPATTHYNPVDVADMCREAGGSWASINEAAKALGISPNTASKKLDAAVRGGYLELVEGAKGARGYRIPASATDLEEPPDGMF